MTMSRRRFLGTAGAVAGGAAAGYAAWANLLRDQSERAESGPRSTPPSAPPSTLAANAGRVLVVVQCNGGNDALNTLVPVVEGAYHDLRPGLGIAEADALAIDDRSGMHPSLAPILPYWQNGTLAFFQSIGFANQTRSHFDAMDTWWSANPAQPTKSGWLGRWNDLTQDGSNPLRVISLGARSPALIGARTIATLVTEPASFSLPAPDGIDAAALTEAFLATSVPLSRDELLAASQHAVPASLEAVELVASASGLTGAGGPEEGSEDMADGGITSLLRTAAGIIEADAGTQVIAVSIEGFDTHARQAETHAALLSDVGTGIAQFLDRVDQMGRGDDVLVITTSEFGRRVAENGSGGTDHGAAGTMLVCGNGVAGQVVGEVDLTNLVDGDLPVAIDTRSLYAVALEWLSDEAVAEEVLGGRFDTYGLLS
jgi:uncharacterized protein (DUF1501 family)